MFAIFINKFYIENIRSIAKIDIHIHFDFSNFSIYRLFSILNCKIKNVDKNFNELKFENLSITFLIFLFVENDIITSATNFLIYDSSLYFMIVNKNRFFRSIIRSIIIDRYIYSIFFVLFIVNNILFFNFRLSFIYFRSRSRSFIFLFFLIQFFRK